MDGQAHGPDPLHWSIPVEDAIGRDRLWRIGVRDGQVVSHTPPGEGFTIKNPQYAAAAILQASELADLQRVEKR